MARFYIHVRNGDLQCHIDEEGCELPGLRGARALAVTTAGEIIAEELAHGQTDVALTFFIDQKNGEPLVTIPVTAWVNG